MPSNFFNSRSRGMHPTPSACYPPPPPPNPGEIDGYVNLVAVLWGIGNSVSLIWDLNNNAYPIAEPFALVHNLPGLDVPPVLDAENDVGGSVLGFITGPAGTYFGNARATWPNGQVRTYPLGYVITP